MKYPARVISIPVFASLIVACAGQFEQAQSQRIGDADSIRLVCEAVVTDDSGNRNHFLRARRIGTSRSASDGEALSCLAQHQSAN